MGRLSAVARPGSASMSARLRRRAQSAGAWLEACSYSNPKAGHQLPSDFGCDETKPVTKSHCGTFCCRLADEKRG